LLARLDEEEASILYLHEVDGLGVDEVADVLGISRKTVWRKLSRLKSQ